MEAQRMRVSLSERDAVVAAAPGRLASVALPFVEHPRLGRCLVVTVRSTVNGHNGAVMSHAGEVVLFGGARDQGEVPARAALRELCEESGTLAHLEDSTYLVGDHVGQWVTESGYLVDGFTISLPPSFVTEAVPEPREVDRIGYLPWSLVASSPDQPEYHHVHRRDRCDDLPGEVEFESPTIRVQHPDDGEEWVLWGLAGHMVAQLQQR